MPIKVTDRQGNVTHRFVGRVIEVRHTKEQRNLSDTLDCSDYQTVEVTRALVYRGRVAEEGLYVRDPSSGEMQLIEPGDVVPLHARFAWIDCSNLFTWRGSDLMEPAVDPLYFGDPLLYQDYVLWKELEDAREAKKKAAEEARREAIRKAAEEAEHDRPVVGKRMKVVSGRKVPVGTQGTVSFVGDGRVLLKDDDRWQDRKADGRWVDPRHLRAR